MALPDGDATMSDSVAYPAASTPFQPSDNALNPLQAAIHAHLTWLRPRSAESATVAAIIPILERLAVLGGRLGVGKPNGFTCVTGSTTLAILGIKELLSDPSLPQKFVQLFDQSYKPHFVNLKWRFSEAFEMMNFFSNPGHRDDGLFDTRDRNCYISIPVSDIQDCPCCRESNRESQACSCMFGESCHICDDAPLYPSLALSAPDPEVEVDFYQKVNRSPCRHAQFERMFLLLAARITDWPAFEKESLQEEVQRLQRRLVAAWRQLQVKKKWVFSHEMDYPPLEQNHFVPIGFVDGRGQHQVAYRCALTELDGVNIVHWTFAGQLARLI
ncbi:hypothetical protein LTR85_008488 [Meristemomyces frigidus]|nr:hypothetical protein LTR85_008488 [Meristemomyces frigidus]